MTDTDTISTDRRRELVNIPVTLDGLPARITGAALEFPMIRNANTAAEFSWPTVDRIVRFGGEFAS